MRLIQDTKIRYFALVFTLILFGSFSYTENNVWAEEKLNSNPETLENSQSSSLEEYQKYRTLYGKDTAREDMKDNGRIDNSISSNGHSGPSPLSDVSDENKVPVINYSTYDSMSELDGDFKYSWKQDGSISGYEYSSYINEPSQIKFLDKKIIIPNDSSSQKLQHDYGILLSNEEVAWKQDHSFAILQTMNIIPQDTRDYYQKQNTITSKWILTEKHIGDDIQIRKIDNFTIVTISLDAFENANPKLALIEDKQGKYFSQKLHHALVQFVTDNGKDTRAIEKILNERFGVSTKIPDMKKLTKNTTNESEKSFQEFHSWELVEIINMFEEMPTGFHSIEGLDYLVRRADGVSHPLHPDAPAVAWASINPGYIEFMESAFRVDDSFLHRLIIHEKSHFLWNNLFSNQLKDEWVELGGWYKDDSDSGWSTSKTTEFASSYSHVKNPDEDMAESIAFFVTNPEKLKSRSLPKYEFIQDRVMQGNSYQSIIREDLTFKVYNLYPDYIYPGKIIRVDISIIGEKNEDKKATIEIELNANNSLEFAQNAKLRLFSEIGTYVDVTLNPIEGDSGSILRGNVVISKYAKNGFWYTNQIIVSDKNGNQRFEDSNDFGWKFFINNPNEDIISPQYVKNTLTLNKKTDNTTYQRPIQILTVSWQVNENQEMKRCFARIIHEDPESYSLDSWGKFDDKNKTCNVDFKITEYNHSGNYNVRYVMMVDMAGNSKSVDFTKLEEDHGILIYTKNSDEESPYLDVNNINISATPIYPQEPNGETQIKITYYAKDDKSGLGKVSYSLRDPQGIEHNNYHYHENFHSLFFKGTPDQLKKYEISLLLPEGAPPGKWGLTYMKLVDKASNQKTYEFTEIVHFVVN